MLLILLLIVTADTYCCNTAGDGCYLLLMKLLLTAAIDGATQTRCCCYSLMKLMLYSASADATYLCRLHCCYPRPLRILLNPVAVLIQTQGDAAS